MCSGRFPYPGPDTDNAVWMMGNPNWGTINLHLGEVSTNLFSFLVTVVSPCLGMMTFAVLEICPMKHIFVLLETYFFSTLVTVE